jgi:carbamoyl-phosphate synthase large subunit
MAAHETRVLVTGAGGIGGVNFVNSLRLAEKQDGNQKYFLAGTEYNRYYIEFAAVDARISTPKHTDSEFLPTILRLLDQYNIEFVHPQPSVEAKLLSSRRQELAAKTYLPPPEDTMPDKLMIYQKLSAAGVPSPVTRRVGSVSDLDGIFSDLGSPLWIRARLGAGGRLGLKVNSPEEAALWMKFNVLQRRASEGDFLIHEFLPGRDLAFDSLWLKGKMVLCFSRERLEYPLKNISLSGITGTPSVARILHESELTRVGTEAVRALNPEPHGFYSVDIKEDASGRPRVTEVDGKWHTTAALWGYAFAKTYGRPELNVAHRYVQIGCGLDDGGRNPVVDLFPKDHYLIRQMDSGVILKNGGGESWQVL